MTETLTWTPAATKPDADPGVVSFILDQHGGGDYIYVTLDGLRALVAAAEQLKEATK